MGPSTVTTEASSPADDAAACRLSQVVAPVPATLPRAGEPGANPARWMYERLATYIKQFEARLDEQHEIGARLVSFGTQLTFHIEDMGYYGPDMIVFYGKNDAGEPVQLIQHTSQLSVLLVAVRKNGERPRRIGFILDDKVQPVAGVAVRPVAPPAAGA
jgi:hypothetical protein